VSLRFSDELPRSSETLVVGAGVVGVWVALLSLRGIDCEFGALDAAGDQVTLLDAWGCAHPRATSADETRILHLAHGADPLLTNWAWRARERWLAVERETSVSLFSRTGVIWWTRSQDGWEDRSVPLMLAEGLNVEVVPSSTLVETWPAFASADVGRALLDLDGGVLRARTACRTVAGAFERDGGCLGLAAVMPGRARGDRLIDVVDRRGDRYQASQFVFACGPWLPKVFPEVVGNFIRVTKQDVVILGLAERSAGSVYGQLPPWIDRGQLFYGIPADPRGFKLGANRLGPEWDPSNGERVVDPDSIRLARRYVRTMFPILADQPVVETRVCQYETTPDENFVIDQHPYLRNVWLVGGGSGRGFKHAPSIAEYLVARMGGLTDHTTEMARRFSLTRDPDGPDSGKERLGDRISVNWGPF